MKVTLITSGIIPASGRPETWGFWEDVMVGRLKIHIDYVYLDLDTGEEGADEALAEVWAHVYTNEWKFVGTWLVGEVYTPLTIKEIRVRMSRRALQRLDGIMGALRSWILEGVEQHADMA